MVDRIEATVAALLDDGKFVVTLGGEHTVSVGAVRAHLRRYPDLSVLAIDAHADVRDEYLDSRYNHACPLRRIAEACPIVQVGMRSASPDQLEFIRERDLTFLTPAAYRALAGGPGDVVQKLTPNVYVDIDLDGIDPSQMSAVGTPEPGGLFWDEVIELLTTLAEGRTIVGFDLVELAPNLGPPKPARPLPPASPSDSSASPSARRQRPRRRCDVRGRAAITSAGVICRRLTLPVCVGCYNPTRKLATFKRWGEEDQR